MIYDYPNMSRRRIVDILHNQNGEFANVYEADTTVLVGDGEIIPVANFNGNKVYALVTDVVTYIDGCKLVKYKILAELEVVATSF